MTGWLSDARRPVVLGLATAALIGLMAGYAAYCSLVPQDWDAVVSSPDAYDGEEVLLSLFTIERVDGPDRFLVYRGLWHIPVVGPTDGLRAGTDVTVAGTFDARQGVVRQTWREDAPLRGGKRILGLGAILVLGLLWPSFFAVRDGRLVHRA